MMPLWLLNPAVRKAALVAAGWIATNPDIAVRIVQVAGRGLSSVAGMLKLPWTDAPPPLEASHRGYESVEIILTCAACRWRGPLPLHAADPVCGGCGGSLAAQVARNARAAFDRSRTARSGPTVDHDFVA